MEGEEQVMRRWVQVVPLMVASIVLVGCSSEQLPTLGNPPSPAWTAPQHLRLSGLAGERVVLFEDHVGLRALDLTNGDTVWEVACEGMSTLAEAGGVCLNAEGSGGTIFDTATGNVRGAVDVGSGVMRLLSDRHGFYALMEGDTGRKSRLDSWSWDGKRRWSVEGPVGGEPSEYSTWMHVAGGYIQVVHGWDMESDSTDESNEWWAVYDTKDGREIAARAAVTEHGFLQRMRDDGSSELLDDRGDVTRVVPGRIADQASAAPPRDTLIVITGDEHDEVRAINEDGSVRWSARSGAWTRALQCGDRVVIGSVDRFRVLDVDSGAELWNRFQDSHDETAQCVDDLVLITATQVEGNEDAPQTMLALARDTGEERWAIPVSGPGVFTTKGMLVWDPLTQSVRLYR